MKTLNTILIFLGIAMVLTGIIWYIVLQLMAWDTPMTKIREIIYLWKPVVLFIVGALLLSYNLLNSK